MLQTVVIEAIQGLIIDGVQPTLNGKLALTLLPNTEQFVSFLQ